MDKLNNEFKTLSMEDNYDEYDEEVVERDEYVDGEGYDEEYDEEGEYADEEYADEEEYADDEYADEGYDDQYYDDKLNQVLDELAELKKGINTPQAVSQSQPFIYPHQSNTGGNEVVMYNEISRLRDELNRTQNSQDLHIELSRLKEDMEKDKKFNEAQFLSEIKRLNERVEQLQGAPKHSNPYLAPSMTTLSLPEGSSVSDAAMDALRNDFNKLVAINEAILHNAKDADGKMQTDLAAIKKNLASTVNLDDVKSKIDKLMASVEKVSANSQDTGIADDLAELRTMILSLPTATGSVSNIDVQTDDSGIIKHLISLKSVLGSVSEEEVRHTDVLVELYDGLNRVKYDMSVAENFAKKLSVLYAFVFRVEDCNETDIESIVKALDTEIAAVNQTAISGKVLNGLAQFSKETAIIRFKDTKQNIVKQFVENSETYKNEKVEKIMDVLSDFIDDKNEIQEDHYKSLNEKISSEMLALYEEYKSLSDDKAKDGKANEIYNLFNKLSYLTIGDVSPLPRVNTAKTYKESEKVTVTVFDKLTAIENLLSSEDGASAGQANADVILDEVAVLKDEIAKLSMLDEISFSILDVKNDFLTVIEKLDELLAGKPEEVSEEAAAEENEITTKIFEIRDELKNDNHNEIQTITDVLTETRDDVGQLRTSIAATGDGIDNLIKTVNNSTDEFVQLQSTVLAATDTIAAIQDSLESFNALITVEDKQAFINDLDFIKVKLQDYETGISQLGDIRSDILTIPSLIDFTPNFDKLYEDVYAQIDKLYEDLAALNNETVASVLAAITELRDFISQNLSDPELKQSVEETRLNVEDIKQVVYESKDIIADNKIFIGDSIADLKANFDNFTESMGTGFDLASADRIKLLEDIAYIRSQIEANGEEAAAETEEDPLIVELTQMRDRVDNSLLTIEDKLNNIELKTVTMENSGETENAALLDNLTILKSDIELLVGDTSKLTILEDVALIKEAINSNNDESINVRNQILDDLILIKEGLLSADSSADKEIIDQIASDLLLIKDKVLSDDSTDNFSKILDEVNALHEAVEKSDDTDTTNVILEDLSDVLNRLETLELSGIDNKNELMNALNDIKEDIHLKELEPSINSVTDSQEERQTLLKEISEIRERLAGVEVDGKEQSDTALLQLSLIMDQLTELKNELNTVTETNQNDSFVTLEQDLPYLKTVMEDINEKLNALSDKSQDYDVTSQNITELLNGVAEVKDTLAGEGNVDFKSLAEDILYIRNQIESVGGGVGEESSISNDDYAALAEDIVFIKDKITADSEYDTLAEILALREDVKAARIVDQNDISSELEAVRTELGTLNNEVILDEIRALRDEISNYKEESVLTKASTPTSDELNMVLSEIVSLRDEVQSYKDELSQSGVTETVIDTEDDKTGENITIILDELTALRSDLRDKDDDKTQSELSLNDKFISLQGDLENLKNTVTELKDVISRRTTIVADEHDEQVSASSNELNIVLDEIIDVKAELEAFRTQLPSTVYGEIEGQFGEINRKIEVLTSSGAAQASYDELTMLIQGLSERLDGLVAEKDEAAAAEDVTEDFAILTLKEDIENALHSGKEDQEKLMNQLSDDIGVLRNQLSEVLLNQAISGAGEPSDSGIFTEISSLKEEIAGLKEKLSAAKSEAEVDVAAEIQNLNNMLTGIREDLNSEDNESSFDAGSLEMTALRDDITQLRKQIESRQLEPITQEILSGEEIVSLKDEILQLKSLISDSYAVERTQSNEIDPEQFQSVLSEISELKELLLNSASGVAVETDNTEVMTEMLSLREEIAGLKDIMATVAAPVSTDNSDILSEILSLREQLVNMPISESADAAVETDNTEVMTEMLSLREEIAGLKDMMATVAAPVSTDNSDILSEILSLREQLVNISLPMRDTAVTVDDGDMAVMTEILALREEFAEFKSSFKPADGNEVTSELNDTIFAIKEDVKSIKEEPDLSVVNEILALREEFQSLREEVSSVKTLANKVSGDNDAALLQEIQSLRDQLFAISMANVNDSAAGGAEYESYNNIILDEISALRDEIDSYKATDHSAAISGDIAEIKDSVITKLEAEKDTMLSQLSALKSEIEQLRSAGSAEEILKQLSSLKEEWQNQREADATTMNFVYEMAHLLERQNSYINQSSNTKIADELESIKAELASTLTAPQKETSAIMQEIAKLKEEISATSGETVVIDNQQIIDELVKIKEELAEEKPSQENNLILKEISRLKDEISQFADKEKAEDEDEKSAHGELSKSIHDLKNELSQIANFVSDEDKEKSALKIPKSVKTAGKTAGKTNSGKTNTQSKKTSGKTSPKSSGTKRAVSANSRDSLIDGSIFDEDLSGDELISKIEATSIEIPKMNSSEGEVFNSNYTPLNNTSDDMDLASKLAKQVANKLIMEQLVQQLGDGGVPKNRVEEIVKDILPQEFTTVQLDEQSDQVKRLANSLVLDKLRSRLTGKK